MLLLCFDLGLIVTYYTHCSTITSSFYEFCVQTYIYSLIIQINVYYILVRYYLSFLVMADSASELELESDASSVDGTKDSLVTNEQILRRIESLQQENRVLKTEVETLKLKIKGLNDLNQQLRRNSVSIVSSVTITYTCFIASESRTGRGIY